MVVACEIFDIQQEMSRALENTQELFSRNGTLARLAS